MKDVKNLISGYGTELKPGVIVIENDIPVTSDGNCKHKNTRQFFQRELHFKYKPATR